MKDPASKESLLDEIEGSIQACHLPRALDRMHIALDRLLQAVPEFEGGGALVVRLGAEAACVRDAAREACRVAGVPWSSSVGKDWEISDIRVHAAVPEIPEEPKAGTVDSEQSPATQSPVTWQIVCAEPDGPVVRCVPVPGGRLCQSSVDNGPSDPRSGIWPSTWHPPVFIPGESK